MSDLVENVAKLKELVEAVEVEVPKAEGGNKQAARRARVALNEMKKLATPMRQAIQAVVKPSE
jgi:hypothetical protein